MRISKGELEETGRLQASKRNEGSEELDLG